MLLVVDVLQPFAGDEGRMLHAELRARLPAITRLLATARRRGVPILYVNDQHGPWRSDRAQLLREATRGARGDLARRLRPRRQDLLVAKPGRSAFYQTPLEELLQSLGATRLVIAGVATDVCVLATVSDAVIRKYRCVVPADTCATLDPERQAAALLVLRAGMGVDTRALGTRSWPAG